MKNQNRVIFLSILLIVFASSAISGLWYFFSKDKENRIELYLSQKIEQLHSEYSVTKYAYENLANFFFDSIVDDREFLARLKKGRSKRYSLYLYLLNPFNKLKKFGIHYLSVYGPDGSLILNMNKPSIQEKSEKKDFFKIEKKRTNDLVIKFRRPVYIDGNLVSIIEVAVSYNIFTKELQKLFHSYYEYIVNKLLVDGIAFKYGIYSFIQSDLSPYFYYEKIFDESKKSYNSYIQAIKIAVKDKIKGRLLENKDFATYCKIDGNYFALTFLAIKKDTINIGYIISIKKDNGLQAFETIFWQNMLIGSFLILAILGILGYFIFTKYKYEDLATKDKLTGLFNRHKLQEVAEIEIKRSKRHKRPLSIVLFDIDHFKKINDTYGHDIGDKVLEELGKIIKSNIRKYDYAFRWGGEEFLILAPETNIDQAYAMAEKLRKAVESHTFPEVGKVTISLGVAQIDFEEDKDIKRLIKRADNALYSSKLGGRNRTTMAI